MANDSRKKSKPVPLPAGEYRLHLLLLEPEAIAAGQRVFEVAVRVAATGSGSEFSRLERVDIARLAGGAQHLIERVYPVRLEAGGGIEVRLTPITGQAVICGAVIEPAPVL